MQRGGLVRQRTKEGYQVWLTGWKYKSVIEKSYTLDMKSFKVCLPISRRMLTTHLYTLL